MKIFGFEKLSMVDFPGHLCCTVFTGGCNFKCPFCQNSDLVKMQNLREINQDEIFSYLSKRKGVIDSLCISGGEPTIYPDLEQFIAKIKSLGFLVKLDTNGTNYEMLKRLIENNLVDYVAMDIKNSLSAYGETAGTNFVDLENIKKSVELLKRNKVDYEFRTTLVKQFHSTSTITEMANWLDGAKRIFLQHFVDNGTCLQKGLNEVKKQDAEKFLDILKNHVNYVELRGY